MKILAFDPGKLNFAYAFFDGKEIERYGFVKTMLSSLTDSDYQKQVSVFSSSYKKLLQATKPDHVVIERFQYRPGMGKGAVSEFINIQIGLITQLNGPIPLTLITPAQWKNYLHRAYTPGFAEDTKLPKAKRSLPKFEAQDLIKQRLGFQDLTKHESDAIGMCYYINDKHAGKETMPCLIKTRKR